MLIVRWESSTYIKPYKQRRADEGGLDGQYTPTEITCSVFREGKGTGNIRSHLVLSSNVFKTNSLVYKTHRVFGPSGTTDMDIFESQIWKCLF